MARFINATFWRFLLLSLLIPGLHGVAGEKNAASSDGTQKLKIAVVDLDRILKESERWKDFLNEHEQMEQKAKRTLKKYQTQIRILRSDYANLPQGTERAAKKRSKIRTTVEEYQKVKNKFETEMQNHRLESLSDMFNTINEIITLHAREHDLDLVLKKQDLSVSASQPKELGVIVATADVLFAENKFDITQDVLKELNARYPGEIQEK
ncbi:MAG: OmpH family outer membrane protein [Planctomycetes bacterium]|nr:OmpH family outer membrane protein [Planctomycetota bacterium]